MINYIETNYELDCSWNHCKWFRLSSQICDEIGLYDKSLHIASQMYVVFIPCHFCYITRRRVWFQYMKANLDPRISLRFREKGYFFLGRIIHWGTHPYSFNDKKYTSGAVSWATYATQLLSKWFKRQHWVKVSVLLQKLTIPRLRRTEVW